MLKPKMCRIKTINSDFIIFALFALWLCMSKSSSWSIIRFLCCSVGSWGILHSVFAVSDVFDKTIPPNRTGNAKRSSSSSEYTMPPDSAGISYIRIVSSSGDSHLSILRIAFRK